MSKFTAGKISSKIVQLAVGPEDESEPVKEKLKNIKIILTFPLLGGNSIIVEKKFRIQFDTVGKIML